MKKIQLITARTDAEWPADHRLRRSVDVVGSDLTVEDPQFGRLKAEYLVCSPPGPNRQPPAPDDADVAVTCCGCGTALLRRASAPEGLKPICESCWDTL